MKSRRSKKAGERENRRFKDYIHYITNPSARKN